MEPLVLQVVTDTDRRGAQIFAIDLGEAMRDAGRRVETVALAPGVRGGLELPVLGPSRTGPRALRALRRRLRTASVVVAHGSSTLPACAIATMGTAVPFVYRQISDSLFWAPTTLRRLRVRAGLARAARVVALWEGSADTLVQHFGVDRSKLRVVPNGVPTAGFGVASASERAAARRAFDLPPDDTVVTYVGALAREKGVDLAVDAVARVPGLRLLVVGDGPERAPLEQRAASAAPGRVRFTGSLADPRSAYAATDVLVLATRGGDSMPAVLIEAGLMGIPAVTTPVGGIPDIVVDGETGVLVPVDDLEALTAACRDLVTDRNRAEVLGRAARRRCDRRFSIASVAEQWSTVLDELGPPGGL